MDPLGAALIGVPIQILAALLPIKLPARAYPGGKPALKKSLKYFKKFKKKNNERKEWRKGEMEREEGRGHHCSLEKLWLLVPFVCPSCHFRRKLPPIGEVLASSSFPPALVLLLPVLLCASSHIMSEPCAVCWVPWQEHVVGGCFVDPTKG